MHVRCPHCQNAIDIVDDQFTIVNCPSCGSNVTLVDEQDTVDFATGVTKTVGHFTLEELLGQGAYGGVYRALDTVLERYVAIKIPRKGELNPVEQAKFMREARTAAQLNHKNIVPVHEVGRQGDSLYIASDLVEGINLSDWLTGREPVPKRVATVCKKLANALQHAHDRGIIHRDLKPGNIIMDSQDEPHLTDFGLAKNDAGEITMTATGQILGTPAYMPPEQARGEAHFADARSDVYALGVTMYEMLSGRPPFRGKRKMLTQQIIHDPAPSIRSKNKSIPKDIETICLKCLEKSPSKRYQTAAELERDLENFLEDRPIAARPTSRAVRIARWCRRNPYQTAVISLASCCLGLFSLWAYGLMTRPSQIDHRLTVSVTTNTPNIVAWIAPLDLDVGLVQNDKAVKLEIGVEQSASVRLDPGWYRIECIAADGRIHEVWRLVPVNVSERKMQTVLATNWTSKSAGSLEWQPITFVDSSDEQLAKVSGGEFQAVPNTGNDQRRGRLPETGDSMPDFLLGQFEVTFERLFAALPGRRAMIEARISGGIDPTHAAHSVSFYEALEYCERTGTRLPCLEEYLFVASNAGTTETPWGGALSEIERWHYETPYPADTTTRDQTFHNLLSSVAEWTQSQFMPDVPSAIRDDFKNTRLIVGGGMAIAERAAETPALQEGVWTFANVNAIRSMPALGLRVARSISPRSYGTSNTKDSQPTNER